jgi:hypothetical protein
MIHFCYQHVQVDPDYIEVQRAVTWRPRVQGHGWRRQLARRTRLKENHRLKDLIQHNSEKEGKEQGRDVYHRPTMNMAA